jgi:hypothetical protein
MFRPRRRRIGAGLMPSSRIVACDQDITRINSTAPESEGIRLRKVEAAARGFDLGQGDVKRS